MKSRILVACATLISAVLVFGVAPQATDAAPTPVKYVFDANGGQVSPASAQKTPGKALGTLPVPTRYGYSFMGWRTERQHAGSEITSGSIAQNKETTIYARWAPYPMYQYDPQWANYPYSWLTIARAGCGPSAMSIAVRAITGQNITPKTAAAWSTAHGYPIRQPGRTAPGFFTAWPATYGIKVTAVPGGSSAAADAAALAAVKRGDWVVAFMGPGNWTHVGHYILWYDVEGGTALVRDPNANKAIKVRGTISSLHAQSYAYYIISVPDNKKLYGYPQPTMTQFTLSQDMTGDGLGEILAVDNSGGLWLYPGKKTYSAGANTVGQGTKIGTGFQNMRVYGSGDLDSDGCSDILAINSSGDLWLYPGTCKGTLKASKTKVGWGWNGWRLIPSGDLNSDGKNDLLGINAKGDLYMYPGLGNGHFGKKQQVGYGWKDWELYSAGDLNGDGKADILGINSKYDLYRYYGKGTGRFEARQKTGSGWEGWTLASGADLTGDGRADIVGRNIQMNLYFYQGKANQGFGSRVQIGTGW